MIKYKNQFKSKRLPIQTIYNLRSLTMRRRKPKKTQRKLNRSRLPQ